jgi:NDP-sugar pyrophosphorylase family protein
MKAMIFAAGLGTRLSEITRFKPKALVEINGIPLIEAIIRRLISFGYDDIIINVHHFADQIEDFIRMKNQFGIKISFSDERGNLLDTGGGLKHASWFFDDGKPFLVHNVDVISNIDLDALRDFHRRSGAMATLAVRTRKSSRQLHFNLQNLLCGWENNTSGEKKIVIPGPYSSFGFSGIQIINPGIFRLMTEDGKFGIIDVYLRLSSHYKINAFVHDDDHWIDVGNPENITKAENLLRNFF